MFLEQKCTDAHKSFMNIWKYSKNTDWKWKTFNSDLPKSYNSNMNKPSSEMDIITPQNIHTYLEQFWNSDNKT